jgi:hypothetical protein
MRFNDGAEWCRADSFRIQKGSANPASTPARVLDHSFEECMDCLPHARKRLRIELAGFCRKQGLVRGKQLPRASVTHQPQTPSGKVRIRDLNCTRIAVRFACDLT